MVASSRFMYSFMIIHFDATRRYISPRMRNESEVTAFQRELLDWKRSLIWRASVSRVHVGGIMSSGSSSRLGRRRKLRWVVGRL
jgi:hypothetical protein